MQFVVCSALWLNVCAWRVNVCMMGWVNVCMVGECVLAWWVNVKARLVTLCNFQCLVSKCMNLNSIEIVLECLLHTKYQNVKISKGVAS